MLEGFGQPLESLSILLQLRDMAFQSDGKIRWDFFDNVRTSLHIGAGSSVRAPLLHRWFFFFLMGFFEIAAGPIFKELFRNALQHLISGCYLFWSHRAYDGLDTIRMLPGILDVLLVRVVLVDRGVLLVLLFRLALIALVAFFSFLLIRCTASL